MSSRFRLAAFHIVLAAMLVRALIPAGWMPSPAGDQFSFLTICSMFEKPVPLHHAPDSPLPANAAHDAVCPYAGAAPLADVPAVASIDASYAVVAVSSAAVAVAFAELHSHTPHAPRAPPISV